LLRAWRHSQIARDCRHNSQYEEMEEYCAGLRCAISLKDKSRHISKRNQGKRHCDEYKAGASQLAFLQNV